MEPKDWLTVILLLLNAIGVLKIAWEITRFISRIEFKVDQLWEAHEARQNSQWSRRQGD